MKPNRCYYISVSDKYPIGNGNVTMKLTDIAKLDSTTLNAKMEAKLGWSINTEKLALKDAQNMLESVNHKLTAVRNSNKIHVSEKDPNYTGMLMAQQVLESYISEKAKNPYAIGMAAAMKSTGDEPPLKKSTITKAHKIAKSIQKNESIEAAVKRMINEDEVTQAQSVMAAKDMVDSLQGMLEDIGRMVNEQLPPLTDSIRSNIGDSQAQTFNDAVTGTLNGLLGQLQTARQSVNDAVLGLTGQAPAPMSMPSDTAGADLETGLDDTGPEDEFGASDAATGGELPMGREKRA